MLLHPTLLIILSICLLISFYKNNLIFNIIAYLYPIATIILMIKQPLVDYKLSVFPISLDWPYLNFITIFDFANLIIGSALLLVTLGANIYASGYHKKKEIIIGGLYCGASQLVLFAGELLSLLVGLEIMTVFATILFLYNHEAKNFNALKRYFLTHLFAGSLMLSGIAYLYATTGDINIRSLVSLFDLDNIKGSIMIAFILTGLLINVAAFPFSGWMIKCYPKSSNASFLYLTTFTTKVNIVIIIKLFGGMTILNLIGIMVISTSVNYACTEYKLKTIFCYISLASLGVMLIIASVIKIDNEVEYYLYMYLFIDILYKSLFALIILTLEEEMGITKVTHLHNIKLYKLPLCLILSSILVVVMLFNIPFIDMGAYLKYYMAHFITSPAYYFILLNNILIVAAIISLKNFYKFPGNDISRSAEEQMELNIILKNRVVKQHHYALWVMFFIILVINFVYLIMQIYAMEGGFSKSFIQAAYKQIAISVSVSVVSYFIKFQRHSTMRFNIDILYFIYNFLNYFLIKFSTKDSLLSSSKGFTKENNLKTLISFENQNISIFIIFSILILALALGIIYN